LRRLEAIAAAALFAFAGCAHHVRNQPLTAVDLSAGYRFKTIPAAPDDDRLFVVLAFSGGGTRAAALSYGVLEELKRTEIPGADGPRRLLDEVDVVSSVSGGSFTAAYWAMFGDRIFTDFDSKFLKRPVQSELTRSVFNPKNSFRLTSPYFDRIDLAGEFYDRELFEHKTFGDLVARARRPFLIVNATDMSLGSRFEFTQDRFDAICSDLAKLPIARAVAASSAFPGLLSPITLDNYAAAGCGWEEPEWVQNAIEDRDVTSTRYREAQNLRSYRDGVARRYIHLLDGGVSDNIGLRGTIRSASSTDPSWNLRRMINLHRIDRLVVIVVNAKTESGTAADRKEEAPGLVGVLKAAANAPMANYSFETVEQFQRLVDEWNQDAASRRDCQNVLHEKCPEAALPGGPMPEVKYYPVVVGFDAIENDADRAWFKGLETNFELPSATVDRLEKIGARLLRDSKPFQELLHDLRAGR